MTVTVTLIITSIMSKWKIEYCDALAVLHSCDVSFAFSNCIFLYFCTIFDGWRVLHSADWGSLLSAFQVLTGCEVCKVPDLSAIQPYSWDLLRSVFKLFKLGRLLLVLPGSQAWHDTLLLIMSIVPTELFNVSRLEAWHVKRVCLLRCPRGCEIMNISSSV